MGIKSTFARGISWAAWLAAMMIALAASSASVLYAYRYGTTVAAAEAHPELMGAVLGVADLVKFGLVAIATALYARGTKSVARLVCAVLLVLVGLSLFATISVTVGDRAHADAKVAGMTKLETDLRAEMSTADARIKELGNPKPQKAIEAELDGFKSDERWRTTASCTPNAITAQGSRRFCEKMALTQSLVAQAEEADKLRNRIAEIRKQLADVTPESVMPASPELRLLSTQTGISIERIGLARALLLAIAIELLGSIVPSALWLVRPSPPAAPLAPLAKPARVAAARGSARTPSPTPPAPKRAPLSAARKGRPSNNQDAISFTEAYIKRNGRPPTITEIERAVTGVSRSTAARVRRTMLTGVSAATA